jgi:hypothetical protein
MTEPANEGMIQSLHLVRRAVLIVYLLPEGRIEFL